MRNDELMIDRSEVEKKGIRIAALEMRVAALEEFAAVARDYSGCEKVGGICRLVICVACLAERLIGPRTQPGDER